MNMTVNKYKLDAYQRGFSIEEKMQYSSIYNRVAIFTRIEFVEPDGVLWSSNLEIDPFFYDRQEHLSILQQAIRQIDNSVSLRHTSNTNSCQHSQVQIGNSLLCSKCMAKLGERMQIDVRYN